jgi:hypothetical protein
MPSKYGSHKTVWERHKKWSEKGIWKRIRDSLVSHGFHQKGLIDANDLYIDNSTVPTKKGARDRIRQLQGNQRKQGTCCSSYIHLIANRNRPWTR